MHRPLDTHPDCLPQTHARQTYLEILASLELGSADDERALRYQQHESIGRTILMSARTRAEDRSFWFLGPATYVRHDGERPMAITWKLHCPLLGDLYHEFAAAVVRLQRTLAYPRRSFG
jgi:hypothetical protein